MQVNTKFNIGDEAYYLKGNTANGLIEIKERKK